MNTSISRIQFLRGNFSGKSMLLRPPWAISEASFIDSCTGCNKCVEVCPATILKLGRGQLPQVDFSQGYCTFCGDCEKSCEPNALSYPTTAEHSPWTLKAYFESNCMALQGVICQTCGDNCEMNAISFQLTLGSAPHPKLDPNSCNGCGECYAPCPVSAINIRQEAH